MDEPVDRAVRVAGFVGQSMVLQVIGGPANGSALDRHRAAGKKHKANRWLCVEAAVGQHAVKTGRHAQGDRDVEPDQ